MYPALFFTPLISEFGRAFGYEGSKRVPVRLETLRQSKLYDFFRSKLKADLSDEFEKKCVNETWENYREESERAHEQMNGRNRARIADADSTVANITSKGYRNTLNVTLKRFFLSKSENFQIRSRN